MRFQARHCATCGLRFPVREDGALGEQCPACGAPTERVGDPYETHEVLPATETERVGPPLEALLDNVRSVRNVGSMFRTADGAGVRHMHLGGFTPTPEHARMTKTALGAERTVAWTHHADPVEAATRLVAAGHRLWALEGGSTATSVFELAATLTPASGQPIVLVLGHEVSGIDPRIVSRCERVVCVPMAGVKGSLNVGVAFGVAAYLVRHGWRLSMPSRDPG